MKKFLNESKQAEFNTLIELLTNGDITDEQEAVLSSLRKEFQQNRQERDGKINAIKEQIIELSITPNELYSTEILVESATDQSKRIKIQRVTEKAPGDTSSEKKLRPSDSNEVMIKLPNAPGVKGPSAWFYHRGRVYERAGTSTSPWVVTRKMFPSKLLLIGHSADTLRPYFTPAGSDYFATEAGKAELAALVDATTKARIKLGVAG